MQFGTKTIASGFGVKWWVMVMVGECSGRRHRNRRLGVKVSTSYLRLAKESVITLYNLQSEFFVMILQKVKYLKITKLLNNLQIQM